MNLNPGCCMVIKYHDILGKSGILYFFTVFLLFLPIVSTWLLMSFRLATKSSILTFTSSTVTLADIGLQLMHCGQWVSNNELTSIWHIVQFLKASVSLFFRLCHTISGDIMAADNLAACVAMSSASSHGIAFYCDRIMIQLVIPSHCGRIIESTDIFS